MLGVVTSLRVPLLLQVELRIEQSLLVLETLLAFDVVDLGE